MTAPFNPHAARSRWFTAPLADVTPRERALLDELAGAVAWAEGLVQEGDWRETPEGRIHRATPACRYTAGGGCRPVYVVREAR